MFEIREKRVLAEGIYLTRVHAPRIANSALPGQFVIVRADASGERTPLTIADYDRYLTQKYGNYMQLPPEKNRKTQHCMKIYRV